MVLLNLPNKQKDIVTLIVFVENPVASLRSKFDLFLHT